MSFHHIPVLLAECIDGLAIRPDGIYLDGTAGGAGHSKEIAARLTTGRLIALDQDPDAVAADLVNTASRAELCRILKEYGEEPYAWQIAGKIESARAAAPIETTAQLVQAVASALPPAVRRKDKNPARRTFQALRIAVNGELDALSEGLDVLFAALKPGGRMCVITFHSLEDRLVKQRFRQWATACTCPPEFPVCVCGGKARAKLITKKPVEAAAGEQAENRRARSAKLRILEKL